MNNRKNKFIVIEGLDKAGKTTQAKLLASKRKGLYTKQPGGHEKFEKLRKLVLGDDIELSDFDEALIFSVDRSLHVKQVLLPALEKGRDIICDRYVGSFVAYQGYGRGGDNAFLKKLSTMAIQGLIPDLVILLSTERSFAKIENPDRMEKEGMDFKKRVQEGYMNQLEENKDTWVLVNADGNIAEVEKEINKVVADRFGW